MVKSVAEQGKKGFKLITEKKVQVCEIHSDGSDRAET